MVNTTSPPSLSSLEIQECFNEAESSSRRRHAKILHEEGATLNRAFNFMMDDTYMRPHRHPSPEKNEEMYIVDGTFGLLLFDDFGEIEKAITISNGGDEYVKVPAFAWHTYVVLSNQTIVYETMEGRYEPDTWKELAEWAPAEGSVEASLYLQSLKSHFG